MPSYLYLHEVLLMEVLLLCEFSSNEKLLFSAYERFITASDVF
jgi:hypothetical protein